MQTGNIQKKTDIAKSEDILELCNKLGMRYCKRPNCPKEYKLCDRESLEAVKIYKEKKSGKHRFHVYGAHPGFLQKYYDGDLICFVKEFVTGSDSYYDAVNKIYEVSDLKNGYVAREEKSGNTKQSEEFILPERATGNSHVIAYLTKTRCINKDIVFYLIKTNMLYQDIRNNCVFTGYSDKENIRYAFIRSTATYLKRPIKYEQKNSKKKYSFRICCNDHSEDVYVFESCIDLLSFLSLQKEEYLKFNCVALGGCDLNALQSYLDKHPETKKVYVGTDNDHAGDMAFIKIKQEFDQFIVIRNAPEHIFKDWNDQCVYYKKHGKIKM